MNNSDPRSGTVEVLTRIWRDALSKTDVSPEKSFLELGGDPEAALRIFAEISREYGREYCPLLIYQAPTITQLAALLDQSEMPALASRLPLNTASTGTPIYISHGLEGTVMGLFQLVRRLNCPNPIYGMQARGIDGREAPFECIEDMARYHLAAIREIQPRGPYHLIGYSLGGLVMFEIAQRLINNHEKVGLLLLLDSYPDLRHLQPKQSFRLVYRRAKGRLLSYLPRRPQQERSFTSPGRLPGSASLSMFPRMSAAVKRTKAAQYRALRAYKPSYYDGEISFVQASLGSYFPDHPDAVWSPLVRNFKYETVHCEHISLLTSHAAELAAIISPYLQAALPAPRD